LQVPTFARRVWVELDVGQAQVELAAGAGQVEKLFVGVDER